MKAEEETAQTRGEEKVTSHVQCPREKVPFELAMESERETVRGQRFGRQMKALGRRPIRAFRHIPLKRDGRQSKSSGKPAMDKIKSSISKFSRKSGKIPTRKERENWHRSRKSCGTKKRQRGA